MSKANTKTSFLVELGLYLSKVSKVKIIRKNLLSNPWQIFLTVFCLGILLFTLVPLIKWAVIDSVWSGTPQTCREASGACGLFIIEKARFILFGFYPDELLWRPITSLVLFIGLIIYSKNLENWTKNLGKTWILNIIAIAILMRGGVLGLAPVETDRWGGLPLTLILATVGITLSYPLGVILALCRQSKLVLMKNFSIFYIELIRGVPLISLLFMSSVLFPLFLPEGMSVNKLLRAQLAIVLFSGAYMAEVVRGGLQSIPKGQYEAAQSLGMNYIQTVRYIILPQALKKVIPPTVNTGIGLFKDTSLVIIIALFDMMYTTKASLTDTKWLGFSIEAYIFVAFIYFFFCYSLSKFSQHLEVHLNKERQAS